MHREEYSNAIYKIETQKQMTDGLDAVLPPDIQDEDQDVKILTSVIPSEHDAVLIPGRIDTEYASSETIQANHICGRKSVVKATNDQGQGWRNP